MHLFASLLLLVEAALGGGAPVDSVPAPLSAQVAGAVAHLWGDDSARVRLQWMALPPAAEFPARTDVRLMGRGDRGWFSAVFSHDGKPLFALRVHAGALDTGFVAARAVSQGAALTADDLRSNVAVRWGPPLNAAERPTLGWIARHPLVAGEAITSGTVAPPLLVHVGDTVHLEWRRGAVVIAMDGTALGSGTAGQPVRVRITQRSEEKSGTIVGPDLVRLDS